MAKMNSAKHDWTGSTSSIEIQLTQDTSSIHPLTFVKDLIVLSGLLSPYVSAARPFVSVDKLSRENTLRA